MSHHQPEHDDSANPTSAAPDAGESTDSNQDWSNTGGPAGGGNPEPGGWPGGGNRWSGSTASASAQAWLTQLQSIIDNLATQSAPIVREVGAKAAEIAALAAERAGPLAQRAAEATAQATIRVAEKSRSLAEELRRPSADSAAAEQPVWQDADVRTHGAHAPDASHAAHVEHPQDEHSHAHEDTTAPSGPTV